jgi:hypothetical protein
MNAAQPLPSPASRPLNGRDRGAGTPVHPPAPGDFGRSRSASLANPPRQQYLQLRAGVHRKLLNRLNLEALAQADRGRAESEIRTLLLELLAEEATPLSLSEREPCLPRFSTMCSVSDRSSRCSATRRSATSWSTPARTCSWSAAACWSASKQTSRTTSTCCG